MVQCKFTNSAKRDLEDITDYTLKHWGRQQTIKYLDEIHNKAIALSLNIVLSKTRVWYYHS